MTKMPTREITKRKYRAIQKRYSELYDGKRLRHDDCILQLQKEFFILHSGTIQRILLTKLD